MKQTPTGKYFVSILVETPEVAPTAITVDADLTVGIDLGIKDFLITSHNTTEPNNKFLDNSLKRLKTLQRRLSKKQKGSANRAKARKLLARLHEKVANQRTDAAHQASAELVYKSHDTSFAVEDLNIKDFAIAELGLGKPEDKPVDHALTGVVSDNLVIRGMKQEATTRITSII